MAGAHETFVHVQMAGQVVANRRAAILQRRPLSDRNYRVLFKYPLIVGFRIVERLGEVQVLHVRWVEQ